MKIFTIPNVLLALGAITALAHLVQGTTAPGTVAHKIADKALALLPNVYDLLGVGPDAKKVP